MCGIGTHLLDGQRPSPTANSGSSLLRATQSLARSTRKHGFEIVARGFEPNWQLADIKYEWTASGVVL